MFDSDPPCSCFRADNAARDQVVRIARRYVHTDPDEAQGACLRASHKLQKALDRGSFLVKVSVSFSGSGPDRAPQPTVSHERMWHWVLTVPAIGIVDVTGAQFGRAPLRVLTQPPDAWEWVDHIEASAQAPPPGQVWSLFNLDGRVAAQFAFDRLLAAKEIGPSRF